jgi:hypothetical protein
MVPVFAATVALVLQAGVAPQPVRIWRADSMLYVQLAKPGHLLLMHVDAIGRIDVLYPLVPTEGTGMPGDSTIAVFLPPAAEGNPATFVAVRSRWPFNFAILRAGSDWNYYDAWLLQPTAGDPLAALLDIADRVTDGRPYDYGVAAYTRDGTALERSQPVSPDVCWTCVRPRPAVVAAAAPATNSVDCTNATLTNSFCGVASAPVTITSAPPPQQVAYQPPPSGQVYVLPYYFSSVRAHDGRRFDRPILPSPRPALQRSQGVASPIAPQVMVPSSAAVSGRPR